MGSFSPFLLFSSFLLLFFLLFFLLLSLPFSSFLFLSLPFSSFLLLSPPPFFFLLFPSFSSFLLLSPPFSSSSSSCIGECTCVGEKANALISGSGLALMQCVCMAWGEVVLKCMTLIIHFAGYLIISPIDP